MSEQQFRSMQETAYLLRSPANAAHLMASIAEADAGDLQARALVQP